ncbi:hypothetical protein GFC01_09915 [Desulfofundulus thermobenzoicus]|uniref:Uncharacterized protein n=1 Tax=Desulfofundulus thermobenzoicus TaxID=29376 RepID=A0A6N7IRM7_9FIRM|nr:hypothetical protein [Desulfofundulus thermobenzoicus]MQL52571.1 hypothetical protein [Desulfofundulus thermobenzoicus]HHW43561.1 hypothetical protein [Desulfotomaculum sp.]
MLWPEEILIREVGPRDGLQNEARLIPAEQKIVFNEKLVQAGLKLTGTGKGNWPPPGEFRHKYRDRFS